MKEDVYITSYKFGKEFYIRVEDFRDVVNKIQDKYRDVEEENKKLRETIKDHQLYEKKLEHRIIEFEELLHGE